METRDAGTATLLVHDGELEDVRALLVQLDVPFAEHRRLPTPRDPGPGWDLIVATARHMLEIDSEREGGQVPRIAIAESHSRTLGAAMSRAGVDFLVRRPVHPEALRLLMLHALYRGPERRRAERISAGAPVQFRSGLRLQPGLLLDLSTTGCRIRSTRPARPGQTLTVVLPTGPEASQTLSVRGRVRATTPPQGEDSEGATMRIGFEDLSPVTQDRLGEVVKSFSEGPARLPDRLAPRAPQEESAAVLEFEPVTAPDLADETGADEGDPADQRTAPRRIFGRRVIALGGQATRVLLGRDLSPGGMRSNPDPSLSVGDELSIALPLPAQKVPLVVNARVTRDDGEHGLVLRFFDVSDEATLCLQQSLGLLPICDSQYEDEEPAWVIVSEVLDRRSA